jgi:hypothetical protein
MYNKWESGPFPFNGEEECTNALYQLHRLKLLAQSCIFEVTISLNGNKIDAQNISSIPPSSNKQTLEVGVQLRTPYEFMESSQSAGYVIGQPHEKQVLAGNEEYTESLYIVIVAMHYFRQLFRYIQHNTADTT